MKRSTFIDIACILLIILFVYTGASKYIDFATFRTQLSKSPFITEFSGLIAWTLPGIELIIALLLVIPRYRRTGLYASLLLLTTFTLYLIAMLQFSYDIPCSCGGVISAMSWEQHVYFNVAYIIITIVAIVFTQRTAGPATRAVVAK